MNRTILLIILIVSSEIIAAKGNIIRNNLNNSLKDNAAVFSEDIEKSNNGIHDAAASIIITSPNGGENWLSGSTQNITLTSSGVTNVKIKTQVDTTRKKNLKVFQTTQAADSTKVGNLKLFQTTQVDTIKRNNLFLLQATKTDASTQEITNQQVLAAPNLKPYKPSKWVDIIVVKKSPITDFDTQLSADDSPLYASDNIYLAEGVANLGDADSPAYTIYIYVDNVLTLSGTSSGSLPVNYYNSWSNNSYPLTLSVGTHSIKLVVDPLNLIAESNETDNEYTRNITILQTPSPYSISLSSNPSNGGTTSGGGTYYSGQSVTVTATPNSGYTFTNWTEGGYVVSTSTSYTFTVNSNRTLVANFSLIGQVPSSPILVTPANGATGVSTSPTFSWGSVSGATSYTLQVSTSNTFASYVYNQSGLTTTSQLVMGFSNSTTYYWRVYATNSIGFGPSSTTWSFTTGNYYTVTLSANPSAGGSVTQSGSGTYNSGSSVTVTATSNSGFTFTNWTEGGTVVSSSSSYTFTISSNRTLIANFSALSSIIITTNPTGRSFTVDGTTYSSAQTFQWAVGSTHNVSTTSPQSGSTGTQYIFGSWSDGGAQSHTITVPSTATTYTANFTTQYYLTMNAGTGGTVSPASGWYNSGQSVSINATANSNYVFSSWSGSGSGSYSGTTKNTTVNMNGPITQTASFNVIQYTVSASANPSAGGTTTGAGTYNSGSSVTVTANAASGFTFTNWSEGGMVVSTSTSYTFTVNSNRTLVANFTVISNITIITNPTGRSFTVDGNTYTSAQTFQWTAGSSHTIAVTSPQSGATGTQYIFSSWSDGGAQSHTITTPSTAATYTANFTTQYYLTMTTRMGGTVSPGSGWYNSGQSVSITATAGSGYRFINWTENGTLVSTNSSYTFTITGNRNLTANFMVSQINISQSYSFVNITSQTSYKLIGLPGENNFPLSDIMTGTLDNDWVTYRDNGQVSNYYEKYNGSSNFYIRPGAGFWVLSKNTINVNRTVQSVTVNSNGQYGIALQSGWNIISNPFSIIVNWSNVTSKNSVGSDVPWDYTAGTFVVSQTLEPYKGYYFKNTNGLAILYVPYPTLGKISEGTEPLIQYELTISLNRENKNISEVKIGFNRESEVDYDKYDIYRPMSDFEVERMVIYNTELSSAYKYLYRDMRNSEYDEERYDLRLKVVPNKQYSLSIVRTEEQKDKYIYLRDRKLNLLYDAGKEDRISFSSSTSAKEYELIISKNKIEGNNFSNEIITTNKLYQNYPNPFNPSTTIRYSLENRSYISIKIYNAIGVEVRELVNGYMDNGYYEIMFDGKSAKGGLPSGVYFCRLITDQRTETVKMLLVK